MPSQLQQYTSHLGKAKLLRNLLDHRLPLGPQLLKGRGQAIVNRLNTWLTKKGSLKSFLWFLCALSTLVLGNCQAKPKTTKPTQVIQPEGPRPHDLSEPSAASLAKGLASRLFPCPRAAQHDFTTNQLPFEKGIISASSFIKGCLQGGGYPGRPAGSFS